MLELMLDSVVVLFMLLLRVGIPLLITIGVFKLIQRWQGHQQEDILQQIRAERAKVAQPVARREVPNTVVRRLRCWDVMRCPPPKRDNCPAYHHSYVPCWLAIRLSEGQLREECYACRFYDLRKTA